MIYFKNSEIRCKCGCGKLYKDKRAFAMLNQLREAYGKPIILNSAYRCKNHPEESKKKTPGTHNKGIAFDLRCTPREQVELICIAKEVGFKGFGLAKTFLHVDAREQDHVSAWHYQ